jgi:hypothetical protein
MKRISLLLVPAVVLLTSFAVNGTAQTGPTGSVPNPKSTVVNGQKKSVALTPENLADFLRGEGYQVNIKDIANSKDKNVIATVTRDGWRFVLEFEYMRGQVNLICPLGNSNPQYSAAQWRALMQKNFELPLPMHFSFRSTDQRLILEDPMHAAQFMHEQYVRELVTRMITKARDTHNLWGSPNAVANNPPAPATPGVPQASQAPANQNPPAPAVSAAKKDLANTTWAGSETLGGFGRLTFQFGANGQVTMIDAKETSHGSYTVQNNNVTLRFYDGTVIYTGVINGSTLNGTAQNGESTWSFSVVKQ